MADSIITMAYIIFIPVATAFGFIGTVFSIVAFKTYLEKDSDESEEINHE